MSYEQGFIDKCTACGVDPHKLVKAAQVAGLPQNPAMFGSVKNPLSATAPNTLQGTPQTKTQTVGTMPAKAMKQRATKSMNMAGNAWQGLGNFKPITGSAT